MSKLQKILFIGIIVLIIVLIAIFWGTLFSGIMAYCLVMIVPVYLFNRFINVDREQEFSDE